jgi:hypothetical protein
VVRNRVQVPVDYSDCSLYNHVVGMMELVYVPVLNTGFCGFESHYPHQGVHNDKDGIDAGSDQEVC